MFHFNSLIVLKTLMDGHVVCAWNLRAVWKTDFIPFVSWQLFCPVGIYHCYRISPQNACAQSVSYFCLAQNSVDAFFCNVQAAFWWRFTVLKSSLHWLSVKRIKAVEEALNRWTRKALDDEMPGDLFLSALANSIEALSLKCGCKGITNRSITCLI